MSTPRRLALIARGLPPTTEAVSEEIKGPRASAPPQALEGFLRKTGLTQDQLERARRRLVRGDRQARPRDRRGARRGDPRDRPRLPLAQVDALGRGLGRDREPALGPAAAGHRRPARRGDRRRSRSPASSRGAATVGHRFHHPGAITIGGADDYVEKLRACHVIVDQEEREAIIREGAAQAAADAGLTLVEDEGLVVENAGLTEWPVPLLGRFDPAFLDVPPRGHPAHHAGQPEIFRLRRTRTASSRTASSASPTSTPSDGGAAIVAGNEKVLAARLSDARSSGSRTSRSRSRSRRRSSSRSSSTRSSAPSPTRSSGSRSSPSGWSRKRIVKGADPDHVRARRAARQGRSRHRAWSASSPSCRA